MAKITFGDLAELVAEKATEKAIQSLDAVEHMIDNEDFLDEDGNRLTEDYFFKMSNEKYFDYIFPNGTEDICDWGGADYDDDVPKDFSFKNRLTTPQDFNQKLVVNASDYAECFTEWERNNEKK